MKSEYLTIREAAILAGCSRSVLFSSIAGRRGGRRLRAKKIIGRNNLPQYIIRRGDLELWIHSFTSRKILWRDDEVAALCELRETCTHKQIAKYVGRSAKAVETKIGDLICAGLIEPVTERNRAPFAIPRTGILLAMTCTQCGALRPAVQFKTKTNRGRDSICRRCSAANKYGTHQQNPSKIAEEAFQAASLPTARHNGEPWDQAATLIARDAGKTTFEAALVLGRSYYAVRYRRMLLGITKTGRTRQPHYTNTSAEWVIHFPEAMTVLREHFRRLGEPVPEELYEWADEQVAS